MVTSQENLMIDGFFMPGQQGNLSSIELSLSVSPLPFLPSLPHSSRWWSEPVGGGQVVGWQLSLITGSVVKIFFYESAVFSHGEESS